MVESVFVELMYQGKKHNGIIDILEIHGKELQEYVENAVKHGLFVTHSMLEESRNTIAEIDHYPDSSEVPMTEIKDDLSYNDIKSNNEIIIPEIVAKEIVALIGDEEYNWAASEEFEDDDSILIIESILVH